MGKFFCYSFFVFLLSCNAPNSKNKNDAPTDSLKVVVVQAKPTALQAINDSVFTLPEFDSHEKVIHFFKNETGLNLIMPESLFYDLQPRKSTLQIDTVNIGTTKIPDISFINGRFIVFKGDTIKDLMPEIEKKDTVQNYGYFDYISGAIVIQDKRSKYLALEYKIQYGCFAFRIRPVTRIIYCWI